MAGEKGWRARLRSGERFEAKVGAEMVTEWSSSELSMSAFARETGVDAQRLRYWRGRVELETDPVPALLSRLPKGGPSEPRFLPLVLSSRQGTTAKPGGDDPAVTLVVGSSELRIQDVNRVPASWVAELLHELAGVAMGAGRR